MVENKPTCRLSPLLREIDSLNFNDKQYLEIGCLLCPDKDVVNLVSIKENIDKIMPYVIPIIS